MKSDRTNDNQQSVRLELPTPFLSRIQKLLGSEYPRFLDSLHKPAVIGLRLNPLKFEQDIVSQIAPYQLSPVPWCQTGYLINKHPSESEEFSPGKHPYHAAGLYYLQEPSAMAVAEILDPQPGEHVLDLAAAPGGKSTHIVSLMQNQGLLVANEIHPQRVWELVENLERWGAQNTLISNETPGRLASRLEGFFDRVLIDAPCSGEGMFRKSEAARQEWSPTLVQSCSVRQSAILEEAARLVRPGGILVYSTCTFAPQENESVIERFLFLHAEYELDEIQHRPGYSSGSPDWSEGQAPGCYPVERAVRLWPHRAPGEGHFIARLRRKDTYAPMTFHPHTSIKIPRDVVGCYQAFCHDLGLAAADVNRLMLEGSYLYQLPSPLPDLSGLRLIRIGLWLGTIKRGQHTAYPRFVPAHALALALTPKQVDDSLSLDTQQAVAFLKGEPLDAAGPDGWVLICISSYPLGWGKRVQGVVKNYYPKGLRWK